MTFRATELLRRLAAQCRAKRHEFYFFSFLGGSFFVTLAAKRRDQGVKVVRWFISAAFLACDNMIFLSGDKVSRKVER